MISPNILRAFVFLISLSTAGLICAADSIEPIAGRWTSVGNGPSHSGFYPATLGNGPITPGWSKAFGREINPVAVSDGRVFVTATNFPVRVDTVNSFAVALDSSSGQELWRQVLEAPADAPIVNGDNVLVEAEPPWAVYALRCTDGLTKWIHPFCGFGQLIRTATAPTAGDHVWLGFGQGNLLGLRISDNLLPFVTPIGDGQGGRTKASYYNGVLYATDGNIFNAVDPETGAILWTINASFGYGYSFYDDAGLPVIANGKASGLSPPLGSLTTVDLETRSVLWNVHTFGLAGLPANDGSTVYAFYDPLPNGPISVKAYRADTGALLGEYALTGQTANEQMVSRAQPLVTNDTVLVATDSATYIFDKASFALRTRLPVGGSLSYAAGTLYIVDPSGNLLTYKFASATPEPAPSAWPAPTPPQPPPKTDVELVSVNRAGNSTAIGNSGAVALSANGRYVLFQSAASDLTSLPDTNNYQDYFLRDRQTGNTVLITANPSNTGAATGNVDQQAKLTPDGRFVVFASQRYTLVSPPQQGPAVMRVYVRDVKTSKTTLVGVGQAPHISNDGRYVLFCDGTIVSVRDLVNQTTIFQYSDPAREADANAISGDGRYILFSASSTQRTSGGYPARQCYLHDMVTQTTTLASVDLSGTGMANEDVNRARMSDDGRFVIFDSRATNLASPPPPSGDGWLGSAVYRRDMHQGVTQYLTRGLDRAAVADISNDGAVIAIVADPLFSSTSYLADTRAGTFEQLPYPSPLDMDTSGRFVAFESGGSGGVAADINNRSDIFLYDRKLRTTKLVSHNLAGTSSPSGWAISPILSDDGQTVAFSSNASDLVVMPKYIYGSGDTVFDAYVSSIPKTGHLQNISTRGTVQFGDEVLIGGFIITGEPKKVMVRALGPSLAAYGVVGVLQDPTLSLHDSTGAEIAVNDNWTEERAAVEATGLSPSDPSESALVRLLDPGAYTAIVRANGAAGIGLVELYELEQNPASKLANISTRGVVSSGDGVLIAGLIAGGSGNGFVSVLVRAIGPSLAPFGISNALTDPTLELYDSNGVSLGSNDDWKSSQRSEIEATGLPPGDDRESAMLVTLPPGAYTAIVRTKTGVDGVGLVEVYLR
jgi:Tol biopolymer transport system component